MSSFVLDIRTPESMIFSGKVESVTAKAVDGEIGILADHAPCATVLSSSDVKCRLENGKEKNFSVNGGFLLVSQNHAVVLSQ